MRNPAARRSDCSGSHAQACFRAPAASFGASLAMIHVVFLAFLGAFLADFRAILADQVDEFAVARHEFGGKPAKGGAVDIQRHAARHMCRCRLLAAFGGAIVAGFCAGAAGLDAGLVMSVTHVYLSFS
jgi:hypothetical protein